MRGPHQLRILTWQWGLARYGRWRYFAAETARFDLAPLSMCLALDFVVSVDVAVSVVQFF
ncbi:MAG: hypothetical protein P8M25_03145 [Paracoccaceae bacterium]|nr:hypothetical protein [Paracoccaceae bacterium]